MKKILSNLTVFVPAAAVMLFSCEKDGTEGTDLRIVSDKDVIQANGKFTATKVMYIVCNAVDAPVDAPTPFEYEK